MDFNTIKARIDSGAITSANQLYQHMTLVFGNALAYNPRTSPYHRAAKELDAVMVQAMRDTFPAKAALFQPAKPSRKPSPPATPRRGKGDAGSSTPASSPVPAAAVTGTASQGSARNRKTPAPSPPATPTASGSAYVDDYALH